MTLSEADCEQLPLSGRTILITRTEAGNAAERKRFESLGAKIVELPMITLGPPTDAGAIQQAIEDISSFDWIVFTSANGVRAFFGMSEDRSGEIRAHFACVGSETRKVLLEYGFDASLVPKRFLTGELGRELSQNFDIVGKKVLLARAEKANGEIARLLRAAGAELVEAPIYRVIQHKIVGRDSLLSGVTDVTLTSPSIVEAFVSNFSVEEINLKKIRVHCIGPVTAERAKESGLNVQSVAKTHTINGLVDSLVQATQLVGQPRKYGELP
jgi:uroporphyrinogen III methyltransferase / synthase